MTREQIVADTARGTPGSDVKRDRSKSPISLEKIVQALANVMAFVNRGILRYAHWTRMLTHKRTWWAVCFFALALAVVAASSYDGQPLFNLKTSSPQYWFGIKSIPSEVGVPLRFVFYLLSLIAVSAMFARWMQSNEQKWLKDSFVEILEHARRRAGEEEPGPASVRQDVDARHAETRSLDFMENTTTSDDFRKAWDGAENMYEPGGFMLLMSAVSLIVIFALIFRSMHADFGVFEVSPEVTDRSWFFFSFSKFLNSLPMLNIFDDFRSQADSIRSTSTVGDWATGLAKFCFDFFVISIATSLLIGQANKRRARDFFGADTLLGIIADCRDEKASGMLKSISDALRATVDDNPGNLEAIRFYAASTAMLKAKAQTDKIGSAIDYLKSVVEDEESGYSDATRRAALESALLLLAPIEQHSRAKYETNSDDKRIINLWHTFVAESLEEQNPNGVVASARTFLARTSGMNIGTDRQVERFHEIIEIRRRLGLSMPVPRAVVDDILDKVVDVLDDIFVKSAAENPEAGTSFSNIGYADSWLRDLVGRDIAKYETLAPKVVRIVEARIDALAQKATAEKEIDLGLVTSLGDWAIENRELDRSGQLLRSTLRVPAIITDDKLAALLQSVSDNAVLKTNVHDRSKAIVDNMPGDRLVEFTEKRLKSYASRPMPYLFKRLCNMAIEGEANWSAEQKARFAQAILGVAFRRYEKNPDVDLRALNNKNRESVAYALCKMAKNKVAWASNPTFDFIQFEKSYFNRFRRSGRRSLPEERRRHLLNAVLELLSQSGVKDERSKTVESWVQNPVVTRERALDEPAEPQGKQGSALWKFLFPRRYSDGLTA